MRSVVGLSVENFFNVRDMRVIVTRAARGNGRAIADGFAVSGAAVIYVDQLFSEVGATYEPISGQTVIGVDVTDQNGIVEMLERTGDVDVLINNAGITRSMQEDGDEYWSRTIEVNLTAAYRLTVRVAAGMKTVVAVQS
jgi:NAD(P)-dependent dehydrogenase (short-subunit alcohol dehydrogenase family)